MYIGLNKTFRSWYEQYKKCKRFNLSVCKRFNNFCTAAFFAAARTAGFDVAFVVAAVGFPFTPAFAPAFTLVTPAFTPAFAPTFTPAFAPAFRFVTLAFAADFTSVFALVTVGFVVVLAAVDLVTLVWEAGEFAGLLS